MTLRKVAMVTSGLLLGRAQPASMVEVFRSLLAVPPLVFPIPGFELFGLKAMALYYWAARGAVLVKSKPMSGRHNRTYIA